MIKKKNTETTLNFHRGSFWKIGRERWWRWWFPGIRNSRRCVLDDITVARLRQIATPI